MNKNLIILIFFFLFGGLFLKIFLLFLPIILPIIIFLFFTKPTRFYLSKVRRFFSKLKKWLFPPLQDKNKFGVVYKLCSYCGQNADRSAKKCDNCGRAFE